MALAIGHGNFVQAIALWPTQQAVEDFAIDQRRQHRDIFGRIQQACQAQDGVEQLGVDPVDIHTARGRARGHPHRAGFGNQGGQLRRVDIDAHRQVGVFDRGVDDSPGHRHRDREHQVVEGVVGKDFVGQAHFLAAVGEDAQGRFNQHRHEVARRIVAVQVERSDRGAVGTVLPSVPVHNAGQFGALFFHLGIEGNGLLFGRRHGASSACFFDGHSLAVALQAVLCRFCTILA